MTLHNSWIATATVFLLSTGLAHAKDSEKECAKYKPDRTVTSEASSDKSAAASAKGTIFGGSAEASAASAEKKEQTALSQTEIAKQEQRYTACLAYHDGIISKDEYRDAMKRFMDPNYTPPPPEAEKPSMANKLVGAMANQMAAQQGKGKGKKKPVSKGAQLKAAPKACGRFAHMGIHVPSRYTFNSCKDDGAKPGRFLFHAKDAKGATCEHIRNWASVNGFTQTSSEMSRAKDTLVFTKSGFPDMTVKCVNTPKASGKPTRLVFILAK
jgi:hypothetical protein